ncbi:MAG: hypothetical protein UY92_C0004G0006 [Candidatus Magasanikbacteria bacterium GW2011_GWA2_56_11]|uniref:Uncharacterized protein n=1 Tax=Candidatus Magasanikbacteria bacterium GW2011_GWA2_56_11 TaxID=1619044 RepID=A0A0G1YHK9_9BACT|nr:MAG: hypothetical protein UY92_C0004G0006 [Candidatus Magasanikbacteria bacterium GW2011_GWA2_56_11]
MEGELQHRAAEAAAAGAAFEKAAAEALAADPHNESLAQAVEADQQAGESVDETAAEVVKAAE